MIASMSPVADNPVIVPDREAEEGKNPGTPRIRCPRCGWSPRKDDRWFCTCGHEWHTFDTGGGLNPSNETLAMGTLCRERKRRVAKKRVIGRYPKAFRKMAVERLKRSDNIVALSQELGVHRRLLYKWRDQLEPIEDGEGPPANSRERELRQQVTQLKRVVADKTLEADFFKGALQKIEARRQSRSNSGETASTSRSEK